MVLIYYTKNYVLYLNINNQKGIVLLRFLFQLLFKLFNKKMLRTSVGIKDETGDIIKIITVDEKFL